MLQFTANAAQRQELEGLAYWVADTSYIKERHGADEPELNLARQTIEESIFPALDRLGVPFWVQNSVIAHAENWRRYKSTYLWDALKAKNIYR